MSAFYKLTVKEVRKETKNAVSVLFNVPDELKSKYQFSAGQYVNLKINLDNKEIRRAYSICSSPESNELRIAVKAVKDGKFSQFANSSLKVGDIIEIGMPEGNFSFNPDVNKQNKYIAFAAGSGITPVLSIIKSVLISEPKSSFVLVYGNKSKEETIFFDELNALQSENLDRLTINYVYSQTKSDSEIFGRIEKATVDQVLNETFRNQVFNTFYLCGPEQMIQTVTAVLQGNGIDKNDIKFELFYSAVKETDTEISSSGLSKITILVDGDESSFEMDQKQTILEAALKAGVDAPYSCQGGICSSCLARVTKGTAVMKKNSILSDTEVAEGLILTCQARSTSAEIVVDYDDI